MKKRKSIKGDKNPAYKHGHTCGPKESLEFKSWSHMMDRCRNPKNKDWDRYGGRGITVCERWLEFINFYEDMGPKPDSKYTIERLDNNKGYCPENCEWAGPQTQSRNKRTTIMIEYNGRSLCLKDWAIHFKVSYTELWELVRRKGLDLEWAIEILGGELEVSE
jgi:hypothetical protein